MKLKLLTVCSAIILTSSQLYAQIDCTSGITGSVTGVEQSYNETRGIDVTVLSSDVRLTVMTLNRFDVGPDAMALVGARIYNSSTSALLFAKDTTVYNIFNGAVSIPVSYTLNSGETYRVGFYCGGTNSDNSANMFQPTSFPYIENENHLQVNQAYSTGSDIFPQNINIFVPIVYLEYDTSSVAEGIAENEFSNEINLFPNPAQEIISVGFDGFHENISAEVFDVPGQSILKENFVNTQKITFNISKLAKGIYFLRIISDGKSSLLKFMKE